MSNDLKYHKKILQKVSFDLQLFRKELIKAYEYLSIEDQILLKKWVSEFVSNKSELKNVYLGVISWIFSNLIAPLTTPSIKLDSASIIGNFNWLLL